MNYKDEIQKALDDLTELKISRREIEKELNYSNYYINQQLSKGGNEKLLKGLRQLLEKKRLHNTEILDPGNTFQLADDGPYPLETERERKKDMDALIEVVLIQSKSIHELSETVNRLSEFLKSQTSIIKEQLELLRSQQETIKQLAPKQGVN
jgi:hypothetical protein